MTNLDPTYFRNNHLPDFARINPSVTCMDMLIHRWMFFFGKGTYMISTLHPSPRWECYDYKAMVMYAPLGHSQLLNHRIHRYEPNFRTGGSIKCGIKYCKHYPFDNNQSAAGSFCGDDLNQINWDTSLNILFLISGSKCNYLQYDIQWYRKYYITRGIYGHWSVKIQVLYSKVDTKVDPNKGLPFH